MSTLRNDALNMHKENRGKLSIQSKVPLRNAEDLSLAYSPGVAEPCKDIYQDESKVYEYTVKGNLVAVVSNGTAVLGLGISVRKQRCLLWKEKHYYSNPL